MLLSNEPAILLFNEAKGASNERKGFQMARKYDNGTLIAYTIGRFIRFALFIGLFVWAVNMLA